MYTKSQRMQSIGYDNFIVINPFFKINISISDLTYSLGSFQKLCVEEIFSPLAHW